MTAIKCFTSEELNMIIENHRHWLLADVDKWETMRADLSYAYLKGADLGGADLRGADLGGADLSYAYLRGADLSYADLSYADLRGADLSYAYLRGADLTGVALRGADLRETKNTPYIPMVCPEEGSFIGWKKACYIDDVESDTIKYCLVKLFIPEDARRSSSTTRKCRCDKAQVLGIYSLDGLEMPISAFSYRDNSFVYKVNDIVSINNFDENRWNECSTGIHFFINRQEAIDYEF